MSGISASIQLSAPVEVPFLKFLAALRIRSGAKVFFGAVSPVISSMLLLMARMVSSQRVASSDFQ